MGDLGEGIEDEFFGLVPAPGSAFQEEGLGGGEGDGGGDPVAHYVEMFDRGVAFVQLGYATPRIRKLLDRYAAGSREGAMTRTHLQARTQRQPAP